jgi:hypothetical protein
MIGEGDCVFLFLLAPYFQLHNYLMFLVVSSCAALVSWLLVFRRDGSIPLISVYGICLILDMIYHAFVLG